LSSSATCCSEDRFGLIICFSLQPEFDKAADGCGHDYVFRFSQSTLTQAFLSRGLIVSSGRGVGHLIDRGDGPLAGAELLAFTNSRPLSSRSDQVRRGSEWLRSGRANRPGPMPEHRRLLAFEETGGYSDIFGRPANAAVGCRSAKRFI
jgi:hypothetical protein